MRINGNKYLSNATSSHRIMNIRNILSGPSATECRSRRCNFLCRAQSKRERSRLICEARQLWVGRQYATRTNVSGRMKYDLLQMPYSHTFHMAFSLSLSLFRQMYTTIFVLAISIWFSVFFFSLSVPIDWKLDFSCRLSHWTITLWLYGIVYHVNVEV